MRVFHQDASVGRHAANAPRGISEKHDVAGHAFNGEVFIDRADDDGLELRNHGVQRIFGNGAAAGDGGEAAAAASTHHAVDAIAMQVGSVTSARGGDAFAEHFNDFVEVRAGEIAVRVSAADAIE